MNGIETRDPSHFFVGGEFAGAAKDMPVDVELVPRWLARNLGPCEILTREELLREYYGRSNRLVISGEIRPPTVHLDRHTGLILNPGRGQRPQGEALVPIVPGNEHMTPPALLVIRQLRETNLNPQTKIDSNDWLIRVFFNAYAYGYPKRQVLEERGAKRVETVCALSLVAALNPEKRPLHDQHIKNRDLMELLLYTLARSSRLIITQADYLSLDAVLMFINQGKDAGGSLPWPHAQIVAFPRENTQPLYLGDERDENGQCDRCEGSREKINGKDERLINSTGNVITYAPRSEGASKGLVARVTPSHERHCANFEAALAHAPTFRDLARMIHEGMFRMAVLQQKSGRAEASYNVIFAQDCKEQGCHLFVDVRTGTPVGGFGIVVPEYKVGNRIIRPDVIYQDPAQTAAEFRNLI